MEKSLGQNDGSVRTYVVLGANSHRHQRVPARFHQRRMASGSKLFPDCGLASKPEQRTAASKLPGSTFMSDYGEGRPLSN